MGLRIFALVTDAFGAGGGIAQYNRDLLAALERTEKIESIVVLPRSRDTSAISRGSRLIQLKGTPSRLHYILCLVFFFSSCFYNGLLCICRANFL